MDTYKEGTSCDRRKLWTKTLIMAGISTTVGSALPFGYNIGVVNSPAEIIRNFCNESLYGRYGTALGNVQMNILWSTIVSIFLVGGTAGALSASWFADKFGRKGGLCISSILSGIGGVLFLISRSMGSIETLIAGRLMVGLSAGLVTCVMPMYLTELAPLPLRGAMGVLCPLGITSGVLLGQILSMGQILGTEKGWHFLLAFFLIPVILCSTITPFLPESPKYLYVIKKNIKLSILTLERIRETKREFLEDEINELDIESKDATNVCGDWTLMAVLRDKSLLLPLLLVCSMQAGQQFSGINAVFYYSKSIFVSAGLTDSYSDYATVGAGIVNLGMGVVSIYSMSRFDRRLLFQISTLSSVICLIALGISNSYIENIPWMPYVSIVAVLSYVLCYGIGLGPIPYFIGSELFEVGPRPSAMALGGMANWGGNFAIGMTFPTLQAAIGANSFYIFAFVTLMLFIFTRVYLPETRNRDPSEVSQLLKLGFKSDPVSSPTDSSITDDTLPTTEETKSI